MSQPKINFDFFSSLIIRVPALHISFYQNLTNGPTIEDSKIKDILMRNDTIMESLFLASPDLYEEVCKWITNENYPWEKSEKIKFSILKYLIRMSTRCTPFGLFSACGSGKFSDKTNMNINSGLNHIDTNAFYRRTRLDMQFLGNLGSAYVHNTIIENKLLFYPNNTIYKLGKYYRYIEFTLNENNRNYSLEGLKRTHYLDLILKEALNGKTKNDLINLLISEEITEFESTAFIEELIFNQILVSELELTLTGDDFLNKLIEHIHTIKEPKEIVSNDTLANSKIDKEQEKLNRLILNIPELYDQLLKIDVGNKHSISDYKSITQTILETGISFDRKYLFQTDLFLNSTDFELNEKYKIEIAKTIDLLNKISNSPSNSALENFKKAFIQRYDGEMVPLVKVLDVEAGIGYLQHNHDLNSTPILDSIAIRKSKTNTNITLNAIEKIIYDKLKDTISKNKNSFTLNYSDFEKIDHDVQDLPATFSCIFEIVEENGKEWIVIQGIGGSSAANLLARFCYGNEQIDDLAHEITQYELEYYHDKIVAEIIHLPESRTGNVLRRPNFRTYEIPYLGQSGLPVSQQININDLSIGIKNNRLILWSKKHKKEIIPKLTNAHNYSNNALPIYQFLCDMQFENCKSAIGINLDTIEKLCDFVPRITIGNCIISKSKWIFNKEKNPHFFNAFSELDIPFLNSFPQFVSLIEGDKTLTINMHNSTCVEMLINTVKNKSHFVLEEYLFPSGSLINETRSYFGNQFIIGIRSNKKQH